MLTVVRCSPRRISAYSSSAGRTDSPGSQAVARRLFHFSQKVIKKSPPASSRTPGPTVPPRPTRRRSRVVIFIVGGSAEPAASPAEVVLDILLLPQGARRPPSPPSFAATTAGGGIDGGTGHRPRLSCCWKLKVACRLIGQVRGWVKLFRFAWIRSIKSPIVEKNRS